AVETHPVPGESKTTVGLRNVEDHLVLARDLVEPGLEFGVGGDGARGAWLRDSRQRGDQAAQAERGGARGDPPEKSAAVRSEVDDLRHTDPPNGCWNGGAERLASDRRRRAARRRSANRGPCRENPGGHARSR